jgi:hypothetical protein
MRLLQIFDVFIILVILGQVIGRWGNFANGEAYGNPVTDPSWQWFPYAIKKNGAYFQATFFYESFFNLIGFGIMLWMYLGKRRSFDGSIFSFYCLWYGLVRLFIEGLRSDSLYLWQGGLRVSQLVSVMLILLGIGLIAYHIYMAKKSGKKPMLFVDKSLLNEDYYDYDRTIERMTEVIKEKRNAMVESEGSGFSYDEIADNADELTSDGKSQNQSENTDDTSQQENGKE